MKAVAYILLVLHRSSRMTWTRRARSRLCPSCRSCWSTRARFTATSIHRVSHTFSISAVCHCLQRLARFHSARELTALSHPAFAVSICCPSRAAFFRAQVAHNTNITDVVRPFGGFEVFCEKGYNGHWLPTYLQEAGMDTYYVGKMSVDSSRSMSGHPNADASIDVQNERE